MTRLGREGTFQLCLFFLKAIENIDSRLMLPLRTYPSLEHTFLLFAAKKD